MAAPLFLLIALAFTGQVWGRGVVRLRFVRYENPGGLDEKGTCCDRVITCKKNGCDHAFKVCLDDISRARENATEDKKCRFGFFATEESRDRDTVIFGTKIGKTTNPLVFNFTGPIPVQMALRVLVEDEDSGKDDRVELLKDVITIPASNVESGREWSEMVSGRTKLSLAISVKCDSGYAGRDCNVQCRPPTARDHYSCHPGSGSKICHPGWAGANCDQQAEQCTRDWCNYNVQCVVANGKKSCRCPELLSGDRCQYHQCDQRCADSSGGYCKSWGPGSDQYRCNCGPGHRARESAHGQYCD